MLGVEFKPKALAELQSIPGALPLIEGLLVPLRTNRTLISLKSDSDIMKSIFFQDFDWNALRNKTMTPPYIPPLSSEITENEIFPTGAIAQAGTVPLAPLPVL